MTYEEFKAILLSEGVPSYLVDPTWESRPTDDLNIDILRETIRDMIIPQN